MANTAKLTMTAPSLLPRHEEQPNEMSMSSKSKTIYYARGLKIETKEKNAENEFNG